MSASTGAIVAAAARRAERRIVEQLRNANATSIVNAKPLFDLRLLEERRLQRLIAAGAIREAAPGAYYLDETTLDSYLHKRRKRVLVVLSGMLLAVLALFGLNRK